MKKTILAGAILFGSLISSQAFAYGELWCKVSLGEIQACFQTFDECSRSIEFGTCKPFRR